MMLCRMNSVTPVYSKDTISFLVLAILAGTQTGNHLMDLNGWIELQQCAYITHNAPCPLCDITWGKLSDQIVLCTNSNWI